MYARQIPKSSEYHAVWPHTSLSFIFVDHLLIPQAVKGIYQISHDANVALWFLWLQVVFGCIMECKSFITVLADGIR